ncbi:DUF4350 domain-containing protein [Haloferula chungangensis]|uniref:DUF4350 domain-containing protein n=1 Tax=Haloferula chungangensis TaxID=1048331 RepID=A0ABW2L3W2_9BACT
MALFRKEGEMKWYTVLLSLLLLVGCSYEESTRETGHKGKARLNPYLAAERLLEEFDYGVENKAGWPDLESDISTMVIPVSALSARGYIDELDEWSLNGGHVIVLMNNGEAYLNDWRRTLLGSFDSEEDLSEPFVEWLNRLGVMFDYSPGEKGKPLSADKLTFLGEEYEVFMEARVCPEDRKGEPVMIHSMKRREGRITFVADARPFRNRWIGDYDHAELFLALHEASPYHGTTAFVRNVSLSFFGLLWSRAWPAVTALIVLVLFWLWKNLPRVGPLDSVESTSHGRAYEHHLEALGDFHWRLDRAEGLLRPLRESLIERAQRLALTTGNRDIDLFELIAERAGITRERAERAMTFERSKDGGTFTQLVADLQTIHLSIP